MDVYPVERGALEVRLLGHFEVLIDDRPVTVTANRQRVVLAMLALSAGELVTVERLADALWDERQPGDTRASLHIHVARLRSALGAGWIVTGPGGYRLECQRHQVDVLRFRDLVETAQLDAALALWHGTPFKGIESRLLAESEAPRLVETYLSAMVRRIDLEISAGRYTELTAELHDLVGRYPLMESLWARLIVVLGHAGRRAEALACYERIRAQLADELGVSPGEELRRLHAELLADHPPPGRVPNQLPADIGHFVGRADACSALDALVADWDAGRAALAILHGAGGVGKTSLATHWAHGMRDRFSGGLLFLDLHGYGPGRPVEPAVSLDNLLRALGVPGKKIPAGIDARRALLRTTLAGRRALMMLDNARDAEQVRPLLPGSSTFVLVTSRSRLRGLAVREGARFVQVDRLSSPESRQLLTAALRGRQISYAEEPMTELTELCDHLPLALVIAAERAGRPLGSIEELIGELKELRLDTLDLADDPLSSVRGVLASSYQALTPGTARVFRLLGPQPGPGIGTPAVAALAGVSVAVVRRLLDELCDANLLNETAAGRFRMHDLVRVYAVELAASDERDAAIRRLASWSVHSTLNARLALEPFPPLVKPDDPPQMVIPATFEDDDQAIRWFETEQLNLTAVVHSAAEFDLHEVVYHLVFALSTFLQLRHATALAMELQRLALQATLASGDKVAEALARSQLGISHGRLGEYEQALDSMERAQELFAAAGHAAGECMVAGNRGLTARRAGRPIEALEHHSRALELARDSGDENEVGCLLNNLAMVYLDLDRPAGAEHAAWEAVEIHCRTNDRYLEACAVDTVGLACAAQHKHTEAVSWLGESCRLCRELGDRWSEAVSLRSLGASLLALGDHDAARTAVHRASAILDDLAAADTTTLSRADLAELLSAIDSATPSP